MHSGEKELPYSLQMGPFHSNHFPKESQDKPYSVINDIQYGSYSAILDNTAVLLAVVNNTCAYLMRMWLLCDKVKIEEKFQCM